MVKLNTDVQKTLKALRSAGNTGIHSFQLNNIVGTTRSAARINDLKKLGYIINSKKHVKMGNSWGAVYTLATEPVENNQEKTKKYYIFNDRTNTGMEVSFEEYQRHNQPVQQSFI